MFRLWVTNYLIFFILKYFISLTCTESKIALNLPVEKQDHKWTKGKKKKNTLFPLSFSLPLIMTSHCGIFRRQVIISERLVGPPLFYFLFCTFPHPPAPTPPIVTEITNATSHQSSLLSFSFYHVTVLHFCCYRNFLFTEITPMSCPPTSLAFFLTFVSFAGFLPWPAA